MDRETMEKPPGSSSRVSAPSSNHQPAEPAAAGMTSLHSDLGDKQSTVSAHPSVHNLKPKTEIGQEPEPKTDKFATSEDAVEGRQKEDLHPHPDILSEPKSIPARIYSKDVAQGIDPGNLGGEEEEEEEEDDDDDDDNGHTHVSLDVSLPSDSSNVFTFDVSRLIRMTRIPHWEICPGCKYPCFQVEEFLILVQVFHNISKLGVI
jgi:hypothetical protein